MNLLCKIMISVVEWIEARRRRTPAETMGSLMLNPSCVDSQSKVGKLEPQND
jgi:hypothetical protein